MDRVDRWDREESDGEHQWQFRFISEEAIAFQTAKGKTARRMTLKELMEGIDDSLGPEMVEVEFFKPLDLEEEIA
jgi:hypothetical protein